MAIREPAEKSQQQVTMREELFNKIIDRFVDLQEDLVSLTNMAVHLSGLQGKPQMARLIASSFQEFSYQLDKLGLTIEHSTKAELRPEVDAFKTAMRGEAVFTKFGDNDLGDREQISHDGLALLKITKNLSDDVASLISAVYGHVLKYNSNSQLSKNELVEIREDLRATSSILRDLTSILLQGGTDDGYFGV